jgi:hypothetical protein
MCQDQPKNDATLSVQTWSSQFAPGIGKLFLRFNTGIGIAGDPPGRAVDRRGEGSCSKFLGIMESSSSILSQNKRSVRIDAKMDRGWTSAIDL